jgi:hypothetical protein
MPTGILAPLRWHPRENNIQARAIAEYFISRREALSDHGPGS